MLALLAQAHSLSPADRCEHHFPVLVGKSPLAIYHGGAVVQLLDDVITDFLGL